MKQKSMKSISQVARLTGISKRTLQYYDEIGLLKPSGFSTSGYRLYDEEALRKLQQILFFRELEFSLKEIRVILEDPDFDQIAAFQKQKELFLLKRNRTDRLIQLLERLEKGETCMSFKEFDLSGYLEALGRFRERSTDDIVKYWGNVENFDRFVKKIQDDESEVARLAIKYYGSIENYTEAMKYNLEHFNEIMEEKLPENAREIGEQSDALYARLTTDLSRDVSSDEVQQIVREMDEFFHANGAATSLDVPYWEAIIQAYSSDYVREYFDSMHGKGAAGYAVKAFRYYTEHGGNSL